MSKHLLFHKFSDLIAFVAISLSLCSASHAANNIERQNLPLISPNLSPVQKSTLHNSAVLSNPASKTSKSHIASLSFSWNNPANLAVFSRNGKLWLVFDQPQQFDIEDLKKQAGKLVNNILQFPHPLATLLQISPAKGTNYSIRKEGLLWILDLYSTEIPPHEINNITIFTQYNSLKQPYLYIPSTNSGKIISMIDPEIGDIISIATISTPYTGINTSYTYPEFEILKTMQGMAFVINSPDIILSRNNNGLTLRAQGRALNISGDLENLKNAQQEKANLANFPAFKLQIPQKVMNLNFSEAVQIYKSDILAAPFSQKVKAQIELARYYIYNGLGTNALSILNKIKYNKLPEADTEDFHALSGIANFLAHRYREAVNDFEYGNLPKLNEGIFWRTLARCAYNFNEADNAVLFAHISIISDYPQAIKDQIALIATENSLNSNDDLSAQSFIDILLSVPNRMQDFSARINYLSAQKLNMQGYPRNAVKLYRSIIPTNSDKYSALARYENAVLSQKIGLMSPKTAIKEFEKLRFAWNEKSFKVKVLKQLSNAYLKIFDYHNSLTTLNETEQFITDKAQKDQITTKMVKIFEQIFLSNQADEKLSPIKALALYKDFEWLADLSDKKNAIAQRLADRLVAVDLLNQAQKLLTDILQVPNISTENRARIGSRLAIINLFQEQPQLALEFLDQTEAPNLSPETVNPRRVIRSRALAQLGKIDEALQILADDFSPNALIHKFKLYWDAGRWSEASDTIKYMIEEPKKGQKLSNEQLNYILDWAVTLKKSGKETVLIRMRNKFLPYFVNTKYHSIFNILTNQLEKDKIDLKEIDSIVKDVKTFTAYTEIYQNSVQNNDLK